MTKTVHIPYVEGDHDGSLTTELISQIQQRGGLRYTDWNSNLTLKVRILDKTYDNIGFRHRENITKKGESKRKIIPNESRTKMLAEITVIDTVSQKVLLGPAHILSSTDYDHQNYDLNNNINVFSLGQLSDIDTTEDVLSIPLYRDLAIEIASYLQNHFDELCSSDLSNTKM